MPSLRTKFSLSIVSMVLWACGGSTAQPDASVPSKDGGAVCAPGTWDSDGDLGTACVAWSTCAPGTYVASEGAADRDRQCRPCPSGTFAGQANQVSCAAFRPCEPGSYVAAAGTATTDRLCADCPSGSFSSASNAAQCAAWSDCAAGQRVLAPGTATADRACEACGAGQYSTETNAASCQPVGACLAGTRQTVPGTATSPVECADCEPGTYCAGGDAAQVACGSGTWDADGSATSPCEAWTDCPAGQYVATAGTALADRACAACPSGAFSSASNAAQCAAWSDCAAGQRVLAAGTATADRACEACGAGQYSTETNAASCQPVGACLAGTRQTVPGTATSPVECADCEPGTYCAGGDAAQVACGSGTWDADGTATSPCEAWTDCPAGQYVATAGTALADRACAACENGDTTSEMNATSCSPGAWLLSYFGPAQDVDSDSLHLAYSLDGQRWAGLGHRRPVYSLSDVGTNHIRDPFILRKNDGTFVYLATDWTLAENDGTYWGHPSPRIVVADSTDLITFTNPRLLTVTNLPGPNGEPMHAWAPEAYYDAARGAYAVLWSGNDASWANRIYVSFTRDFGTILDPTPEVLFDPGYSVIDGTLERADGHTYLFFKDETDGSGAPENRGKDIQIARAPSLALEPGSFTTWSDDYVTRGTEQTVRKTTEGPFAVYQPEKSRWILFADFYGNGGVFGAWTAPSLDAEPSAWTALPSTEFSFPSGVRHAHAVRITRAELDALIAHHGVEHRLRTSYSEGEVPFYVAHSWYHGIITTLDDRGRGQLADDFLWKVVPGLADPSDPALVSFEAIGYPGRYLRIDSANPDRCPSCDENSNRIWGLCWWVPEAERNHLLWLDLFQDTATFRADATFRRVPALNGDDSMISLQWTVDPTRYLLHRAYQVFATPISDSAQQNDASFVLERE